MSDGMMGQVGHVGPKKIYVYTFFFIFPKTRTLYFGSKTTHMSGSIMQKCYSNCVYLHSYCSFLFDYFILFLSLHSALLDLFSLSFHDSLLCSDKEERRRGKRKTKSSPPQPCNTTTQHHPHPLTITTNNHNQNKINPKSMEIKSK